MTCVVQSIYKASYLRNQNSWDNLRIIEKNANVLLPTYMDKYVPFVSSAQCIEHSLLIQCLNVLYSACALNVQYSRLFQHPSEFKNIDKESFNCVPRSNICLWTLLGLAIHTLRVSLGSFPLVWAWMRRLDFVRLFLVSPPYNNSGGSNS